MACSPSSTTRGLNVPDLYLLCDREKRERQVDHDASERDVWRDVVLIGVRSDDERSRLFARGLKHTQPGGVGVLKNHVDAARELGERLLPFPR